MGHFTKRSERRQNMPLSTPDMVAWLYKASQVAEPVCRTLLGTWVAVLRHILITRLEADPAVAKRLKQGREHLTLDASLVPDGWSAEDFQTHLVQATGQTDADVYAVMKSLRKKVYELAKEGCPFQPLGTLALEKAGGIVVTLTNAFLDPEVSEPIEEYDVETVAEETEDTPSVGSDPAPV